jgi:hypothetical protein
VHASRYDFLLLRIWRCLLQGKQKEPPSRRLLHKIGKYKFLFFTRTKKSTPTSAFPFPLPVVHQAGNPFFLGPELLFPVRQDLRGNSIPSQPELLVKSIINDDGRCCVDSGESCRNNNYNCRSFPIEPRVSVTDFTKKKALPPNRFFKHSVEPWLLSGFSMFASTAPLSGPCEAHCPFRPHSPLALGLSALLILR